MNFKQHFLTKMVWALLVLIGFNQVFAELSEDDISFINNVPLVPQLEQTSYDGPPIRNNSSYSENHYKKDDIKELGIRLRKRIQLAIDYRNRGDIIQFSEILIDIITQNYTTEESAWAAILLGDFEVSLYNIDEALKYYLYVANIHYNSSFGLAGKLKLGILLNDMGHFEKAEEVILSIINNYQANNPIATIAKNYLKGRYLELARWYLSNNDTKNTEKYFVKYKNYESLTEPEVQ